MIVRYLLHWELYFYRMKIYPPGLIQIALMKEMKMIGVIGEEICLVLFVFFALLITQIFPKYSITWTLYMNSTMENSNQVSAWTFTSKSRCGHVRKKMVDFYFHKWKLFQNLSQFISSKILEPSQNTVAPKKCSFVFVE